MFESVWKSYILEKVLLKSSANPDMELILPYHFRLKNMKSDTGIIKKNRKNFTLVLPVLFSYI